MTEAEKPRHRSRRGTECVCTYPGCTTTYRAYKGRKTDMCKRHVNITAAETGERPAAISAALKAKWRYDPVFAESESKRLADARRRKLETDPEQRARLIEQGKDLKRRFPVPPGGSEMASRRAKNGWAKRLAHIPSDQRENYLFLRRKGLLADERAQLVQEWDAQERAAFRARLEKEGKL